MTTLAWFGTPNDGATCAVTLGSPVVTVTGSSLITGGGSDPGFIGQAFLGPDGSQYEILTVDLATQLTLRSNYRGATVASAGFFQIIPVQGFSRDAAYKLSQLIALITAGSTPLQATKLGINMAAVNAIDITQSSSNAEAVVKILNANAGNAADAIFKASNGTATAQFGVLGTGYTPAGMYRVSGTIITGDGAGGLSYITTAAQPHYWGINNAEIMSLGRTSSFILGKVASNLAVMGFEVTYTTGQTYITATGTEQLNLVRLGSNGNMVRFYHTDASTVIGSISTSAGTTTSYNTSSDEAFKDDIVPAPEVGHLFDATQVSQFTWKANGVVQAAGFVAQDLVATLAEHVPGLVNQRDDGLWEYDPSKLVPMMFREIQSLRSRLSVAGIA